MIQARIGSSRLPGKVLLPLAGRTLLERMIERVRAIKSPARIVIATTTDPEDDRIRDICDRIDVQCCSGSATDLLDRHIQAAKNMKAEIVVKIPSDCPLIDPGVIDRVLQVYSSGNYDFVSNLHPATYPDGNDVEVMSFGVLLEAWMKATLPMEREHTTPYIWERPDRFKMGNVVWETGLDYSMSHRWTIDYPEDYMFVKTVYDELYSVGNPVFGLNDILELLAEKPEVNSVNSKYAGVNWYRHHLGELKTITGSQTKIIG